MDTFIEQIVKKKKTPVEWLAIVGVILGALIVIAAATLFMGFLSVLYPLLVIAAGYGAWWVITNQSHEYEYCVTNGDIDIDRITARRKRKRVVSVAGKKIECVLPYGETPINRAAYGRVVVAAPSEQETGLWYFTYHSKKNGHTLVIFQPENRVLQALYKGLPTLVQMDTKRAMNEKGIAAPRNGGHSGYNEDDQDIE